jgi:2-oxoglutarate ferredoxin oxidoreductase subunit beta
MESMQNALTKKGFSFIEIRSQCPVSYGRKVGQKTGSEALQEYKDTSIRIEEASKLNSDELVDKIIIGKLVERDKEEFSHKLYQQNQYIREKSMGKDPEDWSLS